MFKLIKILFFAFSSLILINGFLPRIAKAAAWAEEKIVNGNFETVSASWYEVRQEDDGIPYVCDGCLIYSGGLDWHSGDYGAHLGGIQDTTEFISQDSIKIPANAYKTTFSYYYKFESADSPGNDMVGVRVYDHSNSQISYGTQLYTPGTNITNWTKVSMDISNAQSKTIDVVVATINGNDALLTDFYIDDISIIASCENDAPVSTLKINNNRSSTTSATVTLSLTASDFPAGVYQARYSNDNIHWSTWSNYSAQASWKLNDSTYGGSNKEGTRYIYGQINDYANNIKSIHDTIIYNPRKIKIFTVRKIEAYPKHPNNEYMVLKNNLRGSIKMTRWKIKNKRGQKYVLPTFTLKPGKSVVIYSGIGKKTSTRLYMNKKSQFWQNKDTIYLYTDINQLILKKGY